MCQLEFIDEIGEENSWLNSKRQYLTKRCAESIGSAKSLVSLAIRNSSDSKSDVKTLRLNRDQIQQGDMVRIRSKDEIRKTLDRSGRTFGCSIIPEMYNLCGKEYRVFKKVDHFFEETGRKMRKCNGIFLLESAYCDKSTCDRSCFFFWHVNWLQKI